jgi:sortase A
MLTGLGGWQVASGAWVYGKARLAQYLLEAAWQQTLAAGGEAVARPWPWADTWPVARLVFPRLGASFIVLAGDSGSSLAFGPGHSGATALPGRPGTAVITGHRDTHFSVLSRVRAGDRIEVERPDGVRVAYRIASLEIADVRRDRLSLGEGLPPDEWPRPQSAEGSSRGASAFQVADRAVHRPWLALALVTCWPFDALLPGGPLRYVVSAYGVGSEGSYPATAKRRIPVNLTPPPQALQRKTGPQLRFLSFTQVLLRSLRVGPPTLRHTKAESTGYGTEPRAMPPRRVHDTRRTGQQAGPGHRADAQRNSAHLRATARAWVGWKETTTRASRMRLAFEAVREAWRPMGFRAPGLPAAA